MSEASHKGISLVSLCPKDVVNRNLIFYLIQNH